MGLNPHGEKPRVVRLITYRKVEGLSDAQPESSGTPRKLPGYRLIQPPYGGVIAAA